MTNLKRYVFLLNMVAFLKSKMQILGSFLWPSKETVCLPVASVVILIEGWPNTQVRGYHKLSIFSKIVVAPFRTFLGWGGRGGGEGKIKIFARFKLRSIP